MRNRFFFYQQRKRDSPHLGNEVEQNGENTPASNSHLPEPIELTALTQEAFLLLIFLLLTLAIDPAPWCNAEARSGPLHSPLPCPLSIPPAPGQEWSSPCCAAPCQTEVNDPLRGKAALRHNLFLYQAVEYRMGL